MTAKTGTAAKKPATRKAPTKGVPKPAALPKGVEVRVAKIRTRVIVGGVLVAYFRNDDLAKFRKAVESADDKTPRVVPGLHDTGFKTEHRATILAALATL